MPDLRNRIPWVRVGAEAAAIVSSILLAFAINAWWALRGDQEVEHEYLTALHSEVNAAISELEDDLQVRETLRTMLVQYLSDGSKDPQLFAEMLYQSSFVNNLSPPMSVLDELVSSGRLRLIQSSEIRQGLVLYRQMMEKNDLNDETHRTFVNTRFIPFLSERIPLIGLMPATAGSNAKMLSISKEDLAALSDDEQFQNIVVERLHHLERGLPRLRSTTEHLKALSVLLKRESG